MASHSIKGKAWWVKIIGDPQPAFNEEENQWSLDVCLDEAESIKLKKWGLEKKIRNREDDRGDYITFTRSEFKRSGPNVGEENEPIKVFQADGKTEWPMDMMIGNGSIVKVKFGIFQIPPIKKFKYPGGLKPVIYEVIVLEHVAYEKPAPKEDKPTAQKVENWNEDGSGQ